MCRTECNRAVNFVGQPRLIGQLVDLKITDSLRSEVLTRQAC